MPSLHHVVISRHVENSGCCFPTGVHPNHQDINHHLSQTFKVTFPNLALTAFKSGIRALPSYKIYIYTKGNYVFQQLLIRDKKHRRTKPLKEKPGLHMCVPVCAVGQHSMRAAPLLCCFWFFFHIQFRTAVD